MPTVHVMVKGRVQGVFFRATAKNMALALDIKGWIKNTPEGHVEVVATGSEGNLQQFIEWCKNGPEDAVVHTVNVTATSDTSFHDFRIIR